VGGNGSTYAIPCSCCGPQPTLRGGAGGNHGGGGGSTCTYWVPSSGGVGAVRVVWPGSTRQFPSTCVGSP
jgi:hypothetical protein